MSRKDDPTKGQSLDGQSLDVSRDCRVRNADSVLRAALLGWAVGRSTDHKWGKGGAWSEPLYMKF